MPPNSFPARLICVALLSLTFASTAIAGALHVTTYNVAGLPNGFSSSTPELNTIQISPLLNQFNLALVQEDFGFHDDLIAHTDHPYISIKDTTGTEYVDEGLGDGLNRFSDFPFEMHTRVTWDDCWGVVDHASDCLAAKGFSFARHWITEHAPVDIYNLHADAGSGNRDMKARRVQLRQLYAFIQTQSAGRAVLVLGDTNSRYTREGDIVPELLAEAGLKDVWLELKRGGVPPEIGDKLETCQEDGLNGGDCEIIDKILYRNGGNVTLTPTFYEVLNEEFVDAEDVPLSDHDPVSAIFEVVVTPEPSRRILAALSLALLAALRRRP